MNNQTTPQTGAQPDSRPVAPDAPPFRYNAVLANEIETRWQSAWDANDAFRTPNPGDHWNARRAGSQRE